MNYDWNFGRLLPYVRAFEYGAVTTLTMFLVVLVLGTIGGVLLGILSRQRMIHRLLVLPLDIIRAVPPIVLILFCYYALTIEVIGTTLTAYWVCVIALSINLAAFAADLVRSSLASMPQADLEAARVLGLSPMHIVRFITFPLILRIMAAPLLMLYLGILKATSLGSVIGVREIVYSGQVVIAANARSLETWIVVSAVYVAIVLPLSYAARRIENWARHGETQRLVV
jgi:His/Glu/Gln/Arg/opine family amino acid ABC transporter permease subunit